MIGHFNISCKSAMESPLVPMHALAQGNTNILPFSLDLVSDPLNFYCSLSRHVAHCTVSLSKTR